LPCCDASEIAGTAAGLLRLFHGERPERSVAHGVYPAISASSVMPESIN